MSGDALEAAIAEAMRDPETAAELEAGRYPLAVRQAILEQSIAAADGVLLSEMTARIGERRETLRMLHPKAPTEAIQRVVRVWEETYAETVRSMREQTINRLQATILHPAAEQFWDEARALGLDKKLTVEQAVQALEALASRPSTSVN